MPITHTPDPVILNANFDSWWEDPPSSGVWRPTDWTKYTAGAPRGDLVKDGSEYINSPYSLKIAVWGSNNTIGVTQDLDPALMGGAYVKINTWCKRNRHSVGNYMEISVDGTGGANVRRLVTTAAWGTETGTLYIPDDATYLRTRLQGHSASNDWYYIWYDALTLTIPEPL